MLCRSLLRRIGVEADVGFTSVTKQRAFTDARLASVGRPTGVDGGMRGAAAGTAVPAGLTSAGGMPLHPRPVEMPPMGRMEAPPAAPASSSDAEAAGAEAGAFRRMTQEEVNRFTTSVGSKENLFNHRLGLEPSNVVDEETGRVEGSAAPDPARYGDWEVNGRCYDF